MALSERSGSLIRTRVVAEPILEISAPEADEKSFFAHPATARAPWTASASVDTGPPPGEQSVATVVTGWRGRGFFLGAPQAGAARRRPRTRVAKVGVRIGGAR